MNTLKYLTIVFDLTLDHGEAARSLRVGDVTNTRDELLQNHFFLYQKGNIIMENVVHFFFSYSPHEIYGIYFEMIGFHGNIALLVPQITMKISHTFMVTKHKLRQNVFFLCGTIKKD